MDAENLIKSVVLEDGTSPKSARYIISLGRLAEGYVVKTVWGGVRDCKHTESYFRPTLAAAQEKFEKILTTKTAGRRSSKRRYGPVGEENQLLLEGVSNASGSLQMVSLSV